MKYSNVRTVLSFGSLGLALVTAACGSDSASGPPGGLGGDLGSGAAQGAGGFAPGAGGFAQGAGGFAPAAGGYSPGAGGYTPTPGAGGAAPGAGGYAPNAGGTPAGAGGYVAGAGGYVQAAGGSDPGAGGTPGAGGSSDPGASRPPCIDNPSEVVLVGDSYITGFASPALQPSLDQVLTQNGIQTGYRNYAVAGTSMGSGGIGLIPPQFDTALAAGKDIRLVIMDGGGNDVLIPALGSPDCKNLQGSSTNAGCQQIVATAIAAATKLMTHMTDSGVRDVVYFFYPHIPPTVGGLGGSNPNEILDYAEPLAADACNGAAQQTGGKLTCHWIDLRQPFADNGGYTNISGDGVHPAQSGQVIIANQIWNTMKANCLGQPASSGCCQP